MPLRVLALLVSLLIVDLANAQSYPSPAELDRRIENFERQKKMRDQADIDAIINRDKRLLEENYGRLYWSDDQTAALSRSVRRPVGRAWSQHVRNKRGEYVPTHTVYTDSDLFCKSYLTPERKGLLRVPLFTCYELASGAPIFSGRTPVGGGGSRPGLF